LPYNGSALDLVANLVSSDVFGSYVVFERDGRFAVAGDILAEIQAGSASVRVTLDGQSTVSACSAGILRQISAQLHDLPIHKWRAYGWLAFEASYQAVGQPTGDETLAHVVVPRYEVLVGRRHVLIRGTDDAGIARIADVITGRQSARPEDDDLVTADISYGADRYRAAVAQAVAEIRAGALQKAIVSRVVPVESDIDIVRTYVCGRRGNTPARSFVLDLGGLQAAGFSPEIVCTSDGVTMTTEPLAGTRALHGDAVTDRTLRAELQSDPKEIFEHAVSVKTAMDELAGVCQPGSVRVEQFLSVQERGSVQHLGSTVCGTLAEGHDAWDALHAAFPAVTASGIPKSAAYDTIRRLETEPRGLYGGAVLCADWRGALDAALVLRSVFRRDGRTWLRAGAGLVTSSTPDREYEETCEKLRSVSRFLVQAADRSHEGLLAQAVTGEAS
jgi:salicylate synthase